MQNTYNSMYDDMPDLKQYTGETLETYNHYCKWSDINLGCFSCHSCM